MADILHNRDATGRISKWAVELGDLEIKFKPRIAIKSQALVDFLAEWRENQVLAPPNIPKHWVMYFDGSLKLEGGSAGVLFISPKGEQLKYVLQILFEVSNNEAEYEALLHGLCLAISLGIKQLLVFGDSIIVVQQVNKELMSFPNSGLLEPTYNLESLYKNCTILQSKSKITQPPTWRL